jgi:alanine or glycine:cation symporter, AGCS family
MTALNKIIEVVNGFVWGFPEKMPWLVIVLLTAGIFITFSLRWIQLFKIKHALDVILGHYDNPDDDGDINHFQALSAALSATIGIGNIAGVALAIRYGGPGALLWMWITAIFGMALKFSEATLAIHYRNLNPDGSASGGPMYYIENGLGKKWKPLAIAFAVLTITSSFGQGNTIQAFTVSDQVLHEFQSFLPGENFWISPVNFLWLEVEPVRISAGLLISIIVGLVIIGGIRRIGAVASKLAPTMALIYVGSGLLILVIHPFDTFSAFLSIFREAFAPRAEIVGVTGGGFLIFLNTMVTGIKRGLFSNEAGQGSAPIAHAAAKTMEPVREGVVAMIGPLIDTLIICSITGLVIISTGVYLSTDLNGSPLTAAAFQAGLAPLFSNGDKVVTVSVLLFAISTVISWSYYGDRSTYYLAGKEYIIWYRIVYVILTFFGSIVSLELVWNFGDAAVGLMAVPNLIALILLAPVVKKLTLDYFSRSHKRMH